MNQPNQPIQPNITPDPQPEISIKPSLPKWGLILIIIAGIIVIGVAGYAVYKYFSPEPDPDLIACALDAQVCPDGSSVGRIAPNCEFAECPEFDDPTADWQTYQDNSAYSAESKFSIQYPTEYWTLDEKSEILFSNNYEKCYVALGVGGHGMPSGWTQGAWEEEVFIANKKASRQNWRDVDNNLGLIVITFQKDNIDYIFELHLSSEFSWFSSDSNVKSEYTRSTNQQGCIEGFNQILSTFKFIEVDPTANWRAYRNEELGFELTFIDAWEGYVVTERLLNWGNLGTSNSFDFGFEPQESLFNISIHLKEQWQNITSQGPPGGGPRYINENNKYVFAYSIGHDLATSKGTVVTREEIRQIISTFEDLICEEMSNLIRLSFSYNNGANKIFVEENNKFKPLTPQEWQEGKYVMSCVKEYYLDKDIPEDILIKLSESNLLSKAETNTQDWKVYTDNDLGIEFKYPRDWEEFRKLVWNQLESQERLESNPEIIANGPFKIKIDNPRRSADWGIEGVENILFQNQLSFLVSSGMDTVYTHDKVISRSIAYFIKLSDQNHDFYLEYHFSYNPQEENLEDIELYHQSIFATILSTFKFID